MRVAWLSVVVLAATWMAVSEAGTLSDAPAKNPTTLRAFGAMGVIAMIIIGSIFCRFVYFLRSRAAAGKSDENYTLCGMIGRWIPGLKPCCACTPQSMAMAAMVFFWLVAFAAALGQNLVFPYSGNSTWCAIAYGTRTLSFALGKICLLSFEYYRLVASFQQSALRLTTRCNICLGGTLFFMLFLTTLVSFVVISYAHMHDVVGVPNGVYCSTQGIGFTLVAFGQLSIIVGLVMETLFLVLFTYRINKVEDMASDQSEPSSGTSTKSKTAGGSKKAPKMSHFKKISVKFATLTMLMTLSSFFWGFFGVIFRALILHGWVWEGFINTLCIWLTFHDEIGEKIYGTLCFPFDQCCLKLHPCAKICCECAVEQSANAAEAIAKMTSISSRGMPSYADELRKEDTGRSIGSTGSVGSADRTADI